MNFGFKFVGNDIDVNNNFVVYFFGVSGDLVFEVVFFEWMNV